MNPTNLNIVTKPNNRQTQNYSVLYNHLYNTLSSNPTEAQKFLSSQGSVFDKCNDLLRAQYVRLSTKYPKEATELKRQFCSSFFAPINHRHKQVQQNSQLEQTSKATSVTHLTHR